MTEISGHCGYSQIGQVGRFHFGILTPSFSTTTTTNIYTTQTPLTKVRACRHSDGQFYVYRLPQQEDTMFLMMMMMPMILMMRLTVTVTVVVTTMTTMC